MDAVPKDNDGARLRNGEISASQSVSNTGAPLQSEGDITTNTRIKDNKKAWIVCFASFAIQVIVLGNLHVFGIYYISFLSEFKASKATTGKRLETFCTYWSKVLVVFLFCRFDPVIPT